MRRILLLLLAVFAVASPAAAQGSFRSDRIIVETRGRGPDVILIPGLGSTATAWGPAVNRLDDTHRLHLVTVRGFGDTAIAGNAEGGIEGPVANEIRRYMAEQRLNRPALIGHSMGGQIALRVAADAREGVSRVMVVDSAPFFPALVDARATSAQIEPIAQVIYQALMLFGDSALSAQIGGFGGDLGAAGDMVFGGLGLQGGDRRILAQGLYEVMTVDLRLRLREITAPVTVAYGWSRDENNPRSKLEALFRSGFDNLRTPARFEPIEGAEHQVMSDQPQRFLAAVQRFLAS